MDHCINQRLTRFVTAEVSLAQTVLNEARKASRPFPMGLSLEPLRVENGATEGDFKYHQIDGIQWALVQQVVEVVDENCLAGLPMF